MGPGKNQAGRLGWGFLLSFPSGYHTAGAIDQIQEGGCGEGGLVTEVGVEVPGLQSSSLRLREPRFAVCKKG